MATVDTFHLTILWCIEAAMDWQKLCTNSSMVPLKEDEGVCVEVDTKHGPISFRYLFGYSGLVLVWDFIVI